MKTLLKDNSIHLEIARSSIAQCRNYCKKQESAVADTFKEFGQLPKEQVQNVWESIKNNILEGVPFEELVDRYPQQTMLAGGGIMRAMMMIKKPPPVRAVVNLCIWGEAGTGKTRWVMDNFDPDDVYVKDKTEWWDGYTGQKVVLWDDFYGEHRFSSMLRYMDIYRCQVQVKGGYTWLFNEYRNCSFFALTRCYGHVCLQVKSARLEV